MLFTTDTKCITSIGFSEAANFVDKNHRHLDRPTGHKFSIALWIDGELRGVAIVGRPLSRHYDKGEILEIYRNCVLPNTPNGCSMLYGACIRRIKKMGYKKAITYTRQSEPGTSLKASNFILDSEKAGGKKWTGKRKYVEESGEFKKRWLYITRPTPLSRSK